MNFFDISFQNEFTQEENITLARQFLTEHFVSRGMVVDFAVHEPEKEEGGINNPHFHFLCPIRPIEQNGKWGFKQRREYVLDENGDRIPDGKGDYVFNAVPTTDWGLADTLEFWREQWAVMCNAKFEEKGLDVRIKNWFNEFFAKDTSRKIRAVQKAKGERGVPLTTNVPYGYIKDKENPQTWLIDPEAASVVKRIFDMCMNGRGPSQIANQLKADGVLTPTAYKDSQGIKNPNTAPENPCGWHSSTVVAILERREYTGCTVNFKTYTNSIWDKKQRDNPVEKQAIFEDTHEAIIEKGIFEKVQIVRQQRQRKTKSGCTSTFSGLVYCADCGEKLYYGATNNGKREGTFFDCSLHWKHKDKCGTHFIRESVLERMVLKHIQLVMGYILRYRQHFIFVMEQQLQLESAEKLQTSRKQLERNERRIAELKRLFVKIYEDNAKGKLNDERFEMMSQNYEAEQKQLEAEVVALRQEIEVQERQNENIERFVRTADKYVDIEEIDPCMLRELIKAIYVEAPDKSSGKRRQKIHIEYDGIGFIPLEELAKKETA